MRRAREMKAGSILANCSGRGDKDVDFAIPSERRGSRQARELSPHKP